MGPEGRLIVCVATGLGLAACNLVRNLDYLQNGTVASGGAAEAAAPDSAAGGGAAGADSSGGASGTDTGTSDSGADAGAGGTQSEAGEAGLPVDPGHLSQVVELAAGGETTCAVTVDGGVHCWGDGNGGKLGSTDSSDALGPRLITIPPAVSVAVGLEAVCARLGDRRVYCWGTNGYGELGRNAPPNFTPKGAAPVRNETDGGDLTDVEELRGHALHFCSRFSDGHVACWGMNQTAQCGTDAPSAIAYPRAVQSLAGAKALAVGFDMSVALTGDPAVAVSWGYAGSGTLGNSVDGASMSALPVSPEWSSLSPALPLAGIAAGDDHTCVIDAQARPYCWGTSQAGETGTNDVGASTDSPHALSGFASIPLASLAAGGDTKSSSSVDHAFTCAVDTSGEVWCWGANDRGQLGSAADPVGSSLVHANPQKVPGLAGIRQLAAGLRHVCALTFDGHVFCWGAGDQGELGNQQTADSFIPVEVSALES